MVRIHVDTSYLMSYLKGDKEEGEKIAGKVDYFASKSKNTYIVVTETVVFELHWNFANGNIDQNALSEFQLMLLSHKFQLWRPSSEEELQNYSMILRALMKGMNEKGSWMNLGDYRVVAMCLSDKDSQGLLTQDSGIIKNSNKIIEIMESNGIDNRKLIFSDDIDDMR